MELATTHEYVVEGVALINAGHTHKYSPIYSYRKVMQLGQSATLINYMEVQLQCNLQHQYKFLATPNLNYLQRSVCVCNSAEIGIIQVMILNYYIQRIIMSNLHVYNNYQVQAVIHEYLDLGHLVVGWGCGNTPCQEDYYGLSILRLSQCFSRHCMQLVL